MADAKKKIVAKLILDWVLPHVPKDAHKLLKAAYDELAYEHYGFNRSGNSTAWKIDALARSSSGVEQTAEGKVFVISTMEGRRPEDIAFAGLFDIYAPAIYPPQERADKKQVLDAAGKPVLNEDGTPKMTPKVNIFESKREQWCESLGFTRATVNRGTRTMLNLEKAGTKELLAAIDEAVPTVFEGTDIPRSSKAQVRIALPSEHGSDVMYASLYDPEEPSVTVEKFREDLARVTRWLSVGYSLAPDRNKQLGRVAKLYEDAILQQRAAASENTPQTTEAAA